MKKYSFYCDLKIAEEKDIRVRDNITKDMVCHGHCYDCEALRAIDMSGNVLKACYISEDKAQ